MLLAAGRALAQGVVHTTQYKGAKKIGTAIFELKLLPNYRLSESVTSTSTSSPGQTKIFILYSETGRPIQLEGTLTSPHQNVNIDVAFGVSVAKLTAHAASQSTTRNMKYPPGQSLEQPSVFWFFKTHPKVGDKCTYTEFDLNRMRWKTQTDTYTGDSKLTYNKQTVTAHKLQNSDGTQFLDNKGLPYRIEAADGSVFKRD
jgi:hypothetical protein